MGFGQKEGTPIQYVLVKATACVAVLSDCHMDVQGAATAQKEDLGKAKE